MFIRIYPENPNPKQIRKIADVLKLVSELGSPIITTSVHDQDEVIEYTTDPELIYEKYRDFADVIIDGGYGRNEASTIVDCTGDEFVIVRQGLGELEL